MSDNDATLGPEIVRGSGTPAMAAAVGGGLRGYEVRGRLGEGAFSVVYEAHQPSVGRNVAIKEIRAELADRPEFIRQFEAEAHLVAQLEHPHIVPLYDYWRDPGSAFLVMRLLRGGSLAARLGNAPLRPITLASIVVDVAGALDTAHACGVIHRDVKPANILLDVDGRGYLTDFGIAVDEYEAADPSRWSSRGSPAYAPPEQLLREPLGPAADIYALAISVFEALTGRLPFMQETTVDGLVEKQRTQPIPLVRTIRPDVPAGIDEVLQRATASDPRERFDSAGAFATRLASAAGIERTRSVPVQTESRNPYKGLAAFGETDASDFHGRRQLINEMVGVTNDHRALAIVGPSGSGKSSVVRAGLVPVLRQLAPMNSWFITTMTPGFDPIANLERALLRVAVDPPAELSAQLRGSISGLTDAVRAMVPPERDVLLVVDQFEELFTLPGREERRLFLDALVQALNTDGAQLRVIVTLRADFYDHPLRHPEFARLIRESTIAVHPLAADELDLAISEPARAVGVAFERGLIPSIVADVDDQPGALPLLQYALTELYEQRDGNVLTRASYDSIGGVSGALAKQAETVFEKLDIEASEATRRLFGRLVTLGEGTEDTRRRVLRSELGAGAMNEALAVFGRARLLSFDRDAATREPTVEVAHEALIREWPRLRRWLSDDRDRLRLLRHLTEASDAWHERGRDVADLYRGGRLEAAEEWAVAHGSEMTDVESAFLDASLSQQRAEEKAEADRLQRLETLRVEAEEARDAADISRVGWQAAFEASDNRQVGLLMAAEAARRSPGIAGRSALQRALVAQDQFLGMLGAGTAYRMVEWLDDDLVVAFSETGIDLFNVDSGQLLAHHGAAIAVTQIRHGDGVKTRRSLGAVAQEGGLVAFVDAGMTAVHVLKASTLIELDRFEIDARVDGLAIAPDGERLAFAYNDGRLVCIELATRQRQEVLAHPGETAADQELETGVSSPFVHWDALNELSLWPTNVHFIDSHRFATTRFYETRVWSALDLSLRRPVLSPTAAYVGGVFDDDGSTADKTVTLTHRTSIDRTTGRLILFSSSWFSVADPTSRSTIHTAQVRSAGSFFFAPKLVQIAARDAASAWTMTNQGSVVLTDLATGNPIGNSFETQTSGASDLAASKDGSRLAVAGETGMALVAAAGQRLMARAVPRNGRDAASFGNASGFVARFERSYVLPPDIYRLEQGEPTAVADRMAISAWVEKDGGELFTAQSASAERPEHMWITPWITPDQQRSNGFPIDMMWEGSAQSHDRGLWACGVATEAVVVDLDTSKEVARTTVFEEVSPSSLTFSADDERLAVASLQGGCRILAAPDWHTIGTPLDDLTIAFVKFSPDGQWLVTVDDNGRIELRDATTYEVVRTMLAPQSTAVPGAAIFHRGGELLEINVGGLPQLYDVATGEPIGDRWPADPGLSGFHSPDNTNVAITGIGDHFLLWNLDVDSWFDIACRAAGRNMTPEEWELFGPLGKPYRPTCEMWPALG